MVFLYGKGEDDFYNVTLFNLPREIVDSYFPESEIYLIPEEESISQLVERAKTYEEKNNFREASHYYLLAYKKVKNPKIAPYLKFKQSLLLESIDESLKGLEEIYKTYPSFPLIDGVRFELARYHYLKKEYEPPIRYLLEIEESEVKGVPIFTPYVYTFLGIIEKDLKRYDRAVDYYKKSLKILSNFDPEGREEIIIKNYLEMSKSLIALMEYGEAEELLKKILGSTTLTLYQGEALFFLGYAYREQEKVPLSFSAFSQLIQSYPYSPYHLEAEKILKEMKKGNINFQVIEIKGVYDGSFLTRKYGDSDSMENSIEEEAGSSKSYVIQIGSFSDLKNAESLTRVLLKRGFNAYTSKAFVQNRDVYRVRVGGFGTKKEAEEVMKTLEGQGYKGIIVRD